MNDVFSILAISQLATVALYFGVHHRHLSGQLSLLLSVSMIAFILTGVSAFEDRTAFRFILSGIGSIVPFLLFLVAHSLFQDQEKIRKVDWLLAVFYISMRCIGVPLYNPELENSGFYFAIIFLIPQLIMVYFSILALYSTAQGYRSDLIEGRRQLRVYFIVTVAVILVVRLGNGLLDFSDPFLENWSIFSLTPLPNFIFPAVLFLLSMGLSLFIFRDRDELFDIFSANQKSIGIKAKKTVSDSIETEKIDYSDLVHQIIRLMEEDRLYKRHGLTIAGLASELSIHDHKLRKIINREMKFRNFNQFLNFYRLKEACERLRDTNAPISTIALDVGYSSLSSFNSVFKTEYGNTPTMYREGNQAAIPTDPASNN